MGVFKRKHPWDKFYKKNERTIKVPNMSLYELILEANKENLNGIAINYFGRKITYRQFFAEIDACAKAFIKEGITPGDVITICMANTPEAVYAFYAANKIGAIASMLHPLSAEEEIKDSLISTKSSYLIAINLSYEKIKNIIKDTDVKRTVIVTPGDSMPQILKMGYFVTQGIKVELPDKNDYDYLFWPDFIAAGRKGNDNVVALTSKDQPAAILRSGGTTGVPKNIILTNGNINAVVEQVKICLPEIDNTDSVLAILPLFHCFGLVVNVHCPFALGASVSLIPQFDAKTFDKLLTKYKPTVLLGVPTLFESFNGNNRMKDVDLSQLKYIVSGGDTMVPTKNELFNMFLKEHKCKTKIIQGYGMTETAGPVTFGALGSDVLGSVGIPLPSNEVKIVNPDTKETLKTGEIGEIYITGPSVMTGYLDNEIETNEVLEKEKGKLWIHTGDLGYLNEDGVLFFVQRLKRMLIVSGYNVYPSHIEDVIMEHEAVLNCGVVGIPHPYKVQVPKAYIVLKNGIKPSMQVKKSIKEHCEKNLAKYMLPKEYDFRKSLPKTMLGKVDYRKLDKK